MKAYGKLFRRVFCTFFSVYWVMMGVFTLSEQMDVRREYRNYTFNLLHDGKDIVKEEVEEFDNQEEVIRVLKERLTITVKFSKEFQVLAVGKVFTGGEEIAKTGVYLENGGLDNNIEKIPGGEKYIDLEACFLAPELEDFVKLYIDTDNDKNKIKIIDIKGYTRGSKVIPETLKYYTIDKRPGEHAWHDKDAVLKKEYHFQIEDKEGLVPYRGDYWRLIIPIDSRVNTKYQMNEAVQEGIGKLEDRIAEWNNKTGWEWSKKIGYEAYSTYQNIQTDKGIYDLGFAVIYYPWRVAISRLSLVYLFSALVMVIMCLILTQGMWNTYKKQQLLEKNRRILVDAIAHELKTPLGIIQAYSEGLKEKIAEHKKDHYLEVIIDETTKMNTLILEMLELSKLESKAYELKLETFPMKQLIEELLKNRGKWIEDKKIELSIQIEEPWEITADYKGMEKVINNLISNAIEHTAEGKKVYISIEKGKVVIENEGLPIPEDKLSCIWDTFYKVEDIDNRSGNRSGLGLAIVRNILELHSMPYGVMNTDLGVKFWIDIGGK